jgi:hypothetical protein
MTAGSRISQGKVTRTRYPEVADGHLLAVCRAGGVAGGVAHARARWLYARACREWRERHQSTRQAQAEQVVQEALREVTETAWMAVQLRRGLGGRRG